MKRDYIPYLLVLVAVLPVMVLRDYTPSNELRYLSIADEALRGHTFFAFTNHGVPYADKPPLYFWFVMLCRWATGAHRMWLLSLGSLLPMMGIVGVMNAWVKEAEEDIDRRMQGVMLMTSGLFLGAGLTLRMDMLMALFIVLALREFYRMTEGRGRPWLFPVYLFLGLFTKGPYGLLIPLTSSVAYLVATGRWRETFRYWGLRTWGVLLILSAAWFGMVYAEGGASYLNNLLFHQTVGRAVHSFHHEAPFYYYGVALWYCLAPWSLAVVWAFCRQLRHPRRLPPLRLYFVCVAVASFVMLSLVSAKLQIYFLPAIPFIIYSVSLRHGNAPRILLALPAGIYVLALPALLVAAQMMPQPYLSAWPLTLGTLCTTLCGLYGLFQLYDRRSVLTTLRSLALGLLLLVGIGGWTLPQMNVDIGYGPLCRVAQCAVKATGITDLRVYRLSRADNLDVYLGQQPECLPDTLSPPPGRYLMLTEEKHADWLNMVGRAGKYVVVKHE